MAIEEVVRYRRTVHARIAVVSLLLSIGCRTSEADPPPPRAVFFLVNLSKDGKHALLRELTQPIPLPRFRVVSVETGAIEEELDLPALSKLPYESMGDGGGSVRSIPLTDPGLVEDLKDAVPVLSKFPLGSGGRVAAGRTGRTAFNVGDWVYTALNGAIGPRLAAQASYDPWITPDGKSIVVRRHTGKLDAIEGKYELFATSIEGTGTPQRIDGTAGARDQFAVTRSGDAIRVIVSFEPKLPTCIVEVALKAPFLATQKACLDGGERLGMCVLSPSGAWAACHTQHDRSQGGAGYRLRTLDVTSGKVVFDQVGAGAPLAISDDGLVVAAYSGKVSLVDSKARKVRRVVMPERRLAPFPMFRNATELVTERDGSVVVIDVSKLPSLP